MGQTLSFFFSPVSTAQTQLISLSATLSHTFPNIYYSLLNFSFLSNSPHNTIKMPFFNRAFFTPAVVDPAINIFQLINELDGYDRDACAPQKAKAAAANNKGGRQHQHHQGQCHSGGFFSAPTRTFNPRFDVRETEAAYELHGELAGVDRKNVALEFTEPQTLVISGSVERNYTSGTPQAAVEAAPAAAAAIEPAAETSSRADEPMLDDDTSSNGTADQDEPFTEVTAPRSPSPARSHHATVTDEATEEALERGAAVDNASNEKAVAAPAPAEVASAAKPTAPAERYWFQERSFGQFKRVFTFPQPVDEAAVSARLENGVLSVTIPKAKREARRISVL